MLINLTVTLSPTKTKYTHPQRGSVLSRTLVLVCLLNELVLWILTHPAINLNIHMDRFAQPKLRDVRARGLSNPLDTVDLTEDSDPELGVDCESDTPLPGELSPKVDPQPGDNTSSAFSAVAPATTSTPVGRQT